jgi:hypothetical protein
MSDFFYVTIGLKQGMSLPPILFILFVNDILETIDFNQMTETDLELLNKYLILFADDIVLFTTNPNSLQAQIDNLLLYSIKWDLEINVEKTKVCVFESRKQNRNTEFFINGEKVEIVDNFVYLGVRFNYNGTFKLCVKTLQDQALKAYFNLLYLFDRVDLDVKTKFTLFDAMVAPILLYGAEVWGVYNLHEIDKLHLRFCKQILGVKSQTPNYAVFGELGRMPLYIICKERSIRFWLKIMKNPQSPIHELYKDQCLNINGSCWAKRINSIIDHLGYSYLRDNFDNRINYFPEIKRRLRDQFIQEWSNGINTMPKLEMYCKYKKDFVFEDYIYKIKKYRT